MRASLALAAPKVSSAFRFARLCRLPKQECSNTFGIALAAPDLACRRALSRLGSARMIFGTALAAPDLDGFITDGTRCRHLMTRADALEITPLESPANRGTAIMQGA